MITGDALAVLRKNFPGLQLTCNEASQPQLVSFLKEKTIDLAVMILEGDFPPDYEAESLAELPLVLLVPQKSKVKSATEFWRQTSIAETLVCLPQDNPLTRYLQKGLKGRKIEWPLVMATSSLELVETYVAKGFGIGVSLALPGRNLAKMGLRALPLIDFPRVPVGLVWRRTPKPALEALIKELRRTATQLIKRAVA